ncbi:hypothetical protein BRADI_3g14884v3 [Brachypodium distachyon]|uniref:Secreted protein n=1 Tax=Brachypodium distachyon TaxID=15368 RepID=A0A0Q3LR71_BRADI|nr:hypothetical protein BRADI_3g14884v3 [Brachypodium distachyon]KQJ95045.1 hypothetical protein BRADI_3g14884v3 [Brachypodium distachyon]
MRRYVSPLTCLLSAPLAPLPLAVGAALVYCAGTAPSCRWCCSSLSPGRRSLLPLVLLFSVARAPLPPTASVAPSRTKRPTEELACHTEGCLELLATEGIDENEGSPAAGLLHFCHPPPPLSASPAPVSPHCFPSPLLLLSCWSGRQGLAVRAATDWPYPVTSSPSPRTVHTNPQSSLVGDGGGGGGEGGPDRGPAGLLVMAGKKERGR